MRNTVVFFNSYDFGSTGSLCNTLIDFLNRRGFKTLFVVGNKKKSGKGDYYIYDSNSLLVRRITKLHRILFGYRKDCGSFFETRRVINFIKRNVDFNDGVIFHFHNIQFMGLNIFKIIEFAKRNNIKIVWTLHDCWAFTGGCNHFLLSGCEKYRNDCKKCEQKVTFSKSQLKDKTSVINLSKDNITFVCPSRWVDNQYSKSLLKCRHVVINNGIDTNKWKYIKTKREDKIKLISVASPWSKAKGLSILNELSTMLPSNYDLSVVGLKEENVTGNSIIRYPLVDSEQLAKLYSESDIFVNPTLEDTFPTVNIEALLSGLFIVSFDTGGSAEIFNDETGISVKEKSAKGLLNAILAVKTSEIIREKCRKRGLSFDSESFCNKYLTLYLDLLDKN